MTIDLKKMTRKELEALGRKVEKAIERLKKQDMKDLRQQMENLAAAHGVSIEDVLQGKSGTKKASAKKTPKTKSVAKYANPADQSQTWTGKGRQPNWFKSAVKAGTSPESMAI